MGKRKNGELTDKQEMFISYYITSLDAQDAYCRAFQVGKNTARSNAYKLVNKPEIKAEIQRRLEEAKAKNPYIKSADEVLADLSMIIDNPKSSYNAKIQALELLGKYHKLFTDKTEKDMKVKIVVEDFNEDEED